MPAPLPAFRPGDVLLYRTRFSWRHPWWWAVGWFIRVKTTAKVNHAEVYIGDSQVVAARMTGTRIYGFTDENLYAVWRPEGTLQLGPAMEWFWSNANGTRYDFWGLMRFYLIGRPSDDTFICSELATAFLRAGGVDAFAPDYPASDIAPGAFLISPRGQVIWRRV